MYYDNPHASIVVGLTEQLWLPIQTSFGMVKAEDLKHMITVVPAYVLAATRSLTREQNFQKPKGLRCGKRPIEKQ
jgi:hypothetical protein